MDNPTAESSSTESSDLNASSAADAFSALLGRGDEAPAEADQQAQEAAPAEAEPAPAESADEEVTIELDGKPVTFKKSELLETHKAGLRQADYTRKTMEIADQRKALEAKSAEVNAARAQYEEQTKAAQMQLIALVNGGIVSQPDPALLDSDPVAYLKQQEQYAAVMRQIQGNAQQLQAIAAHKQAEEQQHFAHTLAAEQEKLLATLPEWKDEAKMRAEQSALRSYLTQNGYTNDDANNITDHRAVILARKAMLYDQMLAKASAATKKVATLPTKVERPGVADSNQGLDRRTAAYQRLAKSGRAEDAAALFASIL